MIRNASQRSGSRRKLRNQRDVKLRDELEDYLENIWKTH